MYMYLYVPGRGPEDEDWVIEFDALYGLCLIDNSLVVMPTITWLSDAYGEL